MELEEFVEDVAKDNHEELESIRKMCEILDKLRNEKTAIYAFSVTSDL